jgi:hypothetical protein
MPDPKNRVIKLSLNKDGNLQHSDTSVNGGDTVRWISSEGDISISFPKEKEKNPFTADTELRAKSGVLTEAAVVRLDVEVPKTFFCLINLGEKTFKDTTGVDTPGS